MDQQFPANISWGKYCHLKCSECGTEQRVTASVMDGAQYYLEFIKAHTSCDRAKTEEKRRVAAQVMAGMFSHGIPTDEEDLLVIAEGAVLAAEALAQALARTSNRKPT